MTNSIANLRRDYSAQSLLETDVAADPISQFNIWWQQALKSDIDEVNAMTLATASADGFPSARIVLLKGFTERGFVFFTNYRSYKAMQLEDNPKACLVFFWKELERQVRITGLVRKIEESESTAYFNSRPKGSKVGALVSPQSKVIESREWIDEQYLRLLEEYKDKEPQRPDYWGGYLVQPVIVEFWQGRPSRLHDRIQYTLEENGNWKIERLAP
jgi:pyridoxamine 5'-phosphate oxidase